MNEASDEQIPGFKLVFTNEQRIRVRMAIERIMTSGVLSLGPVTEEFEQKFAQSYGYKYAVAVNSGTIALQIALQVLDVRDGVVLCPANTNYATAAAIIAAGARIELYDSDVYPDIDCLASRLTSRIRAVVVVHIGGYCDTHLGSLIRLCKNNGVPVVEDCAHAHGAAVDGVAAGRHGLVGAFSFFPTKPISTGEGGMLVTDDANIASMARSYRNQGKDVKGRHVLSGNSWRLPELSAAVGLAQIPDEINDQTIRAQQAASFDNALADTDFSPLQVDPRQRPSFHKYICLAPTVELRSQAVKQLFRHGVSLAGSVYDRPLSALPVFTDLALERLPKAAAFSKLHFCPPLWTRMPFSVAERVVVALATLK